MEKTRLIYLIYRRLRIGLQVFGFILMYGAYTNNLNALLLIAGLGFAFLDVFGVCYNDYYDYKTDLRNKRMDKWIVVGLSTREQMKNLAILTLLYGIALLALTNIYVFAIGVYYSIILIGYSHPAIPLKRNIGTYLVLGSYYLPLPYALSILFGSRFTTFDIFFTLFIFFQAVYLIAHKDVNDTRDKTNLFIGRGWNAALLICIALGTLASLFLLAVSLTAYGLIVLWLLNTVFMKAWLLERIRNKTVTKRFRDWVVLFEFLTPYFYGLLYVLGGP